MKTHTLLTIIALLILITAGGVLAQTPEFKVLASNGNCFYKKGIDKDWLKISIGIKFFKPDSIKLEKGAYLGLVHSNGKTLELKKPGVFSVAKMSKDLSKKTDNVSQKLTNYVFKVVSDFNSVFENKDYKGMLDNTATVERSVSIMINSGFPHTTDLMPGKTTFFWDHFLKTPVNYKFNIVDKSGKPVFSKITKDSMIMVNLPELKLERGQKYYWFINLGDNMNVASQRFSFTVKTDEDIKTLNTGLSDLTKDIGVKPSSPGELLKAVLYEDHQLMLNALISYEKAVRMSPEVGDYQKFLAIFKMKTTRSD